MICLFASFNAYLVVNKRGLNEKYAECVNFKNLIVRIIDGLLVN